MVLTADQAWLIRGLVNWKIGQQKIFKQKHKERKDVNIKKIYMQNGAKAQHKSKQFPKEEAESEKGAEALCEEAMVEKFIIEHC